MKGVTCINQFILEMSKLYKKIQKNEASEQEKLKFKIETGRSCIDYDILMDLIKKTAKENGE